MCVDILFNCCVFQTNVLYIAINVIACRSCLSLCVCVCCKKVRRVPFRTIRIHRKYIHPNATTLVQMYGRIYSTFLRNSTNNNKRNRMICSPGQRGDHDAAEQRADNELYRP